MEGVHHKINASQRFNTFLDCLVQTLHVSHIYLPKAENLGSLSDGSNILGDPLRLLNIPSNNASISTEMNECPNLGRANATISARAEDDLVFYTRSG